MTTANPSRPVRPSAIGDYALISDCVTGALVDRAGYLDWLCLPRYDSPSIFGALLGDDDDGFWRVAPSDTDASSSRAYDDDGMVLVTTWQTSTGTAEVSEAMAIGTTPTVVRRVHVLDGSVEFVQELALRFDYSRSIPWVMQRRGGHDPALVAAAGPDAVVVRGPALAAHRGGVRRHSGTFAVAAGETIDLTLQWYPSYLEPPAAPDVDELLASTREWWRTWMEPQAAHPHAAGPHTPAVRRSLIVLRALTNPETGGIVAAATTSLPEQPGGQRNWDYRYVWLRDASLTIDVLVHHGRGDIVDHWRQWLLRAVAGAPDEVQIMYGIAGERELPERELASLPGYRGARPVRVGNAASEQFQADVIGEVMVALADARDAGVAEDAQSWSLQHALLSHLEKVWKTPDQGIWEIRGDPQAFTHSRAMVWAAFDRGVSAIEKHGLRGPLAHWRALRDEVRADVEAHGYDAELGCFVQYYGARHVDAALLQLPQIGFCAPDDPRMLGTVAAIERELVHDGFVDRYRTESGVDGLPVGENPFLACAFWLAEQYARTGRIDDADTLIGRLVATANDVGLLSEEYDPADGAQAGNTPQALSHLALIRAVDAIEKERAEERRAS